MFIRSISILTVFGTVCLVLQFGLGICGVVAESETTPKMSVHESNTRPVIGIITQVLRDYKRFVPDRRLHIASSYVKWIESAGARALPILLNQDDDYYRKVFQQTNGLLFPGGDNMLDPNQNTPMMVAAKKLYKLAVEANDKGDYYPIWGTCLGLELLSVLSSGKNVLEKCRANDVLLNTTFTARGRLFAPASYANLVGGHDFASTVMNALTTKNLTYHYHHKCLTDDGLKRADLTDFYRPIAYSIDPLGNKFINIMEARNYPFYAVQFHPEKPPFEFTLSKHQKQVPHSKEAIAVSRYFADYFVSAAQFNTHQPDEDDQGFRESLIYSHNPLYTGLINDLYEQRYLFPFNSNEETVTTEFVDRLLDEAEEVPEDIIQNHEPSSSIAMIASHAAPTLISLEDYNQLIEEILLKHQSSTKSI